MFFYHCDLHKMKRITTNLATVSKVLILTASCFEGYEVQKDMAHALQEGAF